MVAILLDLQVSLMVILIRISLITNDVEHLLRCLFSICISSDPIIPLFLNFKRNKMFIQRHGSLL